MLLSAVTLLTAATFASSANPTPFRATGQLKIGILNPYYPGVGVECLSGFGICKLTCDFEVITSGGNPNANVYIQSTADGNLDVLFFRELNQEALNGNLFKVEKDFEIPQNIVEKLQLKQSVIKAGSYPIRTVNNGKRITFK